MKRDRITRAVAGAAVASLVACFLERRSGRPEEAGEKLGRGEAQFRTIFEGMAVGVALVDARGRLVESNPALEEMLGYAGDELSGLHFVELTHPEDAEENLKLYEELMRGGRDHYRLEKRYVKKSGELLWGRLTVSFLRGSGEEADGKASGDSPLAIGMLEDVTERRRTEEALRGSEERYRAVVEQSAEGIYLVDAATRRVLETNPSLQKMLGYSAGELREMELYDLIAHPPEDVEYNLRRTLREGNRFVGERRYRRKDGSVVDVEVGVSVLSYGGKEVVCVIVRDTTERKRVQEALKQSEERFHSLVENAGDAFFIHDLDGRFVDVNQWACDSLGYTREELLGLSVAHVETGFDPAGLPKLWGKVVAGTPITLDGAHRRKDGSTFPVEIRLGVFESDGRRLMLALARDVSERQKAQAALRESERRFRQLFEQSVDALLVHDEEGRVMDCNSEARRSLGYTREELLELSVKDFVEDLLTEEEKRELGENAPWRKALHGEPGTTVTFHQNRHRRKDGTTFPVEVGVGSIDYGGRRLVFASARDITERKELEKRLSHQAFHDSLTGLPNRVLFLDRLGHALARADRRKDSVAVLFLDLDDFKIVNDSLGHGAGDELLVATARRLTASLRPGDTVARLGGDEFTVLLEEVPGWGEVERVVARILDSLAAPFEIAGSEVFVTASIGVVSEASPGSSPEELMREADLAMYRAKEGGKARYEVYEEARTTCAAERVALERELRRALASDEEFEVHYQPKVLLETSEVLGAEALVRWRHPERGLVLPTEFVGLAEETGLILPIGRQVLLKACRQAGAWREARPPDTPLLLSVNVSAKQLHRPDLVDDVAGILAETGLEPRSLVLKINESTMMDGAEQTSRKLEELKDLEVNLAAYELGMGYSSLSYLKRFPLDYLNLDRSYVGKLGKDDSGSQMVFTVIELARSLGIKVVAEGVETADQLAWLTELGCDLAQGYYISKPLPADEVEPFLVGPMA